MAAQVQHAEQNQNYVQEQLQKETAKVNQLKATGGGMGTATLDPEEEEARVALARARERESLAKDEEVERLNQHINGEA